jgi:hypothetical protein
MLEPWKPGQSGNPAGRGIGSRNKLAEKFITALYDDFTEYGAVVIKEVREDRPEIYLKVIASILPRQLSVRSESLFEGLSNADVEQLAVEVRRAILARTPSSDRAGSSAPSGHNKLN